MQRGIGLAWAALVLPFGALKDTSARLLRPRPQSSAPRPGPTLAVRLADLSRFRRRAFAARVVVTPAAGVAEPSSAGR